jgi:ribonuclease VapC
VSGELPVYVLDSFALLAYFNGEPGMERILLALEEVEQGRCRVIQSIISLGEVLYITEREVGITQAQAVLAATEQLPIEVIPATREAVLAAAHIKANYRVSYADAFAIVASIESSGKVITGDPEFKAVEDLITIEWISQGK